MALADFEFRVVIEYGQSTVVSDLRPEFKTITVNERNPIGLEKQGNPPRSQAIGCRVVGRERR